MIPAPEEEETQKIPAPGCKHEELRLTSSVSPQAPMIVNPSLLPAPAHWSRLIGDCPQRFS